MAKVSRPQLKVTRTAKNILRVSKAEAGEVASLGGRPNLKPRFSTGQRETRQ
jgi:hypothetical protein